MFVNILTILCLPRQLVVKTPVRTAVYCLFAALLSAAPVLAGAATDYQSHESIKQAARDYLLRLRDATEQVEIQTGHLDPRLKLAACDKPLETSLPAGGKSIGRTTVGVRCTGKTPWSLYVTATVKIFKSIAVASQTLARGQLISNRDVRLERHDISRLRQPYVTDISMAIGKVVKRPMRASAPFNPTMLAAPLLVRRGQSVTLLAEASGLQVRMTGKSLGNGAAGDRIRVRNILSKRIVEGKVTKAGAVRVDM